MTIGEILTFAVSLAPLGFGVLGALVTLATTTQALLLAIALKFPAVKQIASHVGIVAVDLQKFAELAKSILTKIGLLAIVAIALLLAGCSGTFEQARLDGAPKFSVSMDPPECASIDQARRNWGAVEMGAAFGAGASGIAVIPVDGAAGRWALASGGVVLGIFAAVSKAEADSFAAAWVRECGQTGPSGS